jgi:hypothetical protein
MLQRRSTFGLMFSYLQTVGSTFRYFMRPKRAMLLPVLMLVFVGGLLLLITGGLSYVAPFVYAIF